MNESPESIYDIILGIYLWPEFEFYIRIYKPTIKGVVGSYEVWSEIKVPVFRIFKEICAQKTPTRHRQN